MHQSQLVVPGANASQRLLTRKKAAEMLGLRPQTLAAWQSSGRYQLPVVKIGSKAMYTEDAIATFKASRTVTPGVKA